MKGIVCLVRNLRLPHSKGRPTTFNRRVFAISAAALLLSTLLCGGLWMQESKASPGTGILFGTDASGGNLITIDPFTGVGTVIGSMGIGPVPSLAVDPTTGTMYAGGGAGFPALYIVNPTSGAATLVGDTGLGFAAIGALDFREDGTLFAAVNIVGDGGTGSDHLAIINKTTGAATVIGPFGLCPGAVCTIEGMEAIAFDASGVLYGALSERGISGSPGLYRINTATGVATFVAPILNGFGVPPSGGIVSLQFACDGTLYGGTATAIDSIGDGGRLVRIDPSTGVFAFIGAVGATQGSSLGALALANPCCALTIPLFVKARPGRTIWFNVYNDGLTPQTVSVRPLFNGACFSLIPGYPQEVVIPPGGAYPFQVDAFHCSAIARSQARNRLIVIDAGPCGVKTIQVEWLPR